MKKSENTDLNKDTETRVTFGQIRSLVEQSVSVLVKLSKKAKKEKLTDREVSSELRPAAALFLMASSGMRANDAA